MPDREKDVKIGEAPIPVRFWGTRGSLPAPLGASAVRAKIRDALFAARNRRLTTAEAIDDFIDRDLPFAVKGTYGGNTSCIEIVTGGDEHLLCDLGSGLREFGNHMLARHGPARPQCYNVFLSHMHWDHIMGFPFFAPGVYSGQPDPHPLLPPDGAGGDAAPAVGAVLSGSLRVARRNDRVCRDRARDRVPGRRV